MSFKISISDGTILKKCVESVSFNIDPPPDDYNNTRTYPINSMIITGKIGTIEKTIGLYLWAQIPVTKPECYKEVTVEEIYEGQLGRKLIFDKAFVVSYSEDYSDKRGFGTFSLHLKQRVDKEIELNIDAVKVLPKEIPKSPVTETLEELAPAVAPTVATISFVKRERPKATDLLAKSNNTSSSSLTPVKFGEQFTKKDGKTVLKPNIQYTTPEGYTYTTDHLGRITSAEGTLQLGNAKRNSYAQKTVGREDRLDDDDGGHLIASIFKGSGNFDNLVPMNGNLNKGEWKKLENAWAKALNAKPPQTVKVKIVPVYAGNSQRPESFKLEQTVDNKKLRTRFLKNKPGGK